MSKRIYFLQRYSALTNKRIALVKNVTKKSSIRKADVSPDDLTSSLCSRKDPYLDLVKDLLFLNIQQVNNWIINHCESLNPDPSANNLKQEEKRNAALSLMTELSEDEVYNNIFETYKSRLQKEYKDLKMEKDFPQLGEILTMQEKVKKLMTARAKLYGEKTPKRKESMSLENPYEPLQNLEEDYSVIKNSDTETLFGRSELYQGESSRGKNKPRRGRGRGIETGFY